MADLTTGGVTLADPPGRSGQGDLRTPTFEGGLDTGAAPHTGRTATATHLAAQHRIGTGEQIVPAVGSWAIYDAGSPHMSLKFTVTADSNQSPQGWALYHLRTIGDYQGSWGGIGYRYQKADTSASSTFDFYQQGDVNGMHVVDSGGYSGTGTFETRIVGNQWTTLKNGVVIKTITVTDALIDSNTWIGVSAAREQLSSITVTPLDAAGNPIADDITQPVVFLSIPATRQFTGGGGGFNRSSNGLTLSLAGIDHTSLSVTRAPAPVMQYQRAATGVTTVSYPDVTRVSPPPTYVDLGGTGQRRHVDKSAIDAVRFADIGGIGGRTRLGVMGGNQGFDVGGGESARTRTASAGFDLAYLTVIGGTGGRVRDGQAAPDLLNLVDFGGAGQRQRSSTLGMDYATAVDLGATGVRQRINRAGFEQRFPPANDLVAAPLDLVGLAGEVDYTTVAATLEAGEPDLIGATGPAGSVWFRWQPSSVLNASFVTDPSVRLDAYALPQDPFPNFPEGWFANAARVDPGQYRGAYLQLYRVRTLVDIPADAVWHQMAAAPDNRTDGTGMFLELDIYGGNPGDPSAFDYGTQAGVESYDHSDQYLTWIGRDSSGAAAGGFRTGQFIPADTMIWLLAQQWPDGVLTDPAVTWDVKADPGHWTLVDGTPIEPYTGADLIQVQVPVPSVQWEYDFSTLKSGFAAMTPIGGGVGAVVFDTRDTEEYLIRAYPLDGEGADGLGLSWDAVPEQIIITIPDDSITTPGVMVVNVAQGPPDATVSFTVGTDTRVFGTAQTDAFGMASSIAIVLPEMLEGSYTLNASAAGKTGVATFLVTNDVVYFPPDPPDPVEPAVFPQAPTVVPKWQFQDPVTGTVWAWPINPRTVDVPIRGRVLQVHTTTATLKGQSIILEGRRQPKRWTLQGTLLTLDDVNALRAWKKPYRVYLTDDFGRTFIVKVTNVAAKPVRDERHPENHQVTVTCILYTEKAS